MSSDNPSNPKDYVNPPYYRRKFEVIDVIEAYDLDRYLAAAVQYILRAGSKPTTSHSEDLRKAIWYLERKIAYEEGKDPKASKAPKIPEGENQCEVSRKLGLIEYSLEVLIRQLKEVRKRVDG